MWILKENNEKATKKPLVEKKKSALKDKWKEMPLSVMAYEICMYLI